MHRWLSIALAPLATPVFVQENTVRLADVWFLDVNNVGTNAVNGTPIESEIYELRNW